MNDTLEGLSLYWDKGEGIMARIIELSDFLSLSQLVCYFLYVSLESQMFLLGWGRPGLVV